MTSDYMKFVGPRLKKARDAAGLTQGQVAKITGSSTQIISNEENARNGISIPKLFTYATVYKIGPAFLLPRHPLPDETTPEDLTIDEIVTIVETIPSDRLGLLKRVVEAFAQYEDDAADILRSYPSDDESDKSKG